MGPRSKWATGNEFTKATTIVGRLLLFAFSIILPCVVLFGALVVRLVDVTRERVDSQALQIARSASAIIETDIDGSFETLRALAAAPALLNGDLSEFYRQAREVTQARKVEFLLKSLEGKTLIRSSIPPGQQIPPDFSDHGAASNQESVVSDLLQDKGTGGWLVALSTPVMRDTGAPMYILTMLLEPSHFDRALRSTPRPSGWILAVSDSTGRLIARSEASQNFVGHIISPDLLKWSPMPEGAHRTTTLAGSEVIRGYHWSAPTRWIVAAFIDSEAVDGSSRSLRDELMTASAALIGVGCALAYFFGLNIARPIQSAARTARSLGRGDTVAPVHTSLVEADILFDALASASREQAERTRSIRESELRFRSLFEQSAVGFMHIATDGRILAVNDRVCSLIGFTREECLQRTSQSLTHADDWPSEERVIGELMRGERERYSLEKRMLTSPGDILWVRISASLVRDDRGQPLYRACVLEDASRDRRAREIAGRLASIVQVSPDAMISTSPAGIVETWNPAAEGMLGLREEEMLGQTLERIVPAGRLPEHRAGLAKVIDGHGIGLETIRRHKDGRSIDVALTANPIFSDGAVTSISITMEDIRERKTRERQISLLNRELVHRVKNSLAIVQSIASQTLRHQSDPKQFVATFLGRLQALATANDLLLQSDLNDASLEVLIDRQLLPLCLPSAVGKSGPPTIIPAELAGPLGLAIYELGINCLKHGAWSVEGGFVDINWRTIEDGARLELTWRETRGPRVVPPARRGFGLTLIERGIPDATVTHRLEPSGLYCAIGVPLHAVRKIDVRPAEVDTPGCTC